MLIYYCTDTQYKEVGPINSGIWLSRAYEYWRNGKEIILLGA